MLSNKTLLVKKNGTHIRISKMSAGIIVFSIASAVVFCVFWLLFGKKSKKPKIKLTEPIEGDAATNRATRHSDNTNLDTMIYSNVTPLKTIDKDDRIN